MSKMRNSESDCAGGLEMTDELRNPAPSRLVASHLRDFADFLPENKREDFNATIDDLMDRLATAHEANTALDRAIRSDAPAPKLCDDCGCEADCVLWGCAKGFDQVRKAALENAAKAALRARCPGNGDCADPVECQSYAASEQAQPCPPGCCVMAEPQDVRAVLEAIEREDTPGYVRGLDEISDYLSGAYHTSKSASDILDGLEKHISALKKVAQSAAPTNALTEEAVSALKISDLKIMAAPQSELPNTQRLGEAPAPAGAAPNAAERRRLKRLHLQPSAAPNNAAPQGEALIIARKYGAEPDHPMYTETQRERNVLARALLRETNAAPRSGGQRKSSPDSQESPAAGHCEVAVPFNAAEDIPGTSITHEPASVAPSAPFDAETNDFMSDSITMAVDAVMRDEGPEGKQDG